MDFGLLFDFSREQWALLTFTVLGLVFWLRFDKKYKRSVALIREAEKGNRAAFKELIRLDRHGRNGVILVAENHRHYYYLHVKGKLLRTTVVTFPPRAFLERYMRVLRRARTQTGGHLLALRRLRRLRPMMFA
jgi:hypothetical protein